MSYIRGLAPLCRRHLRSSCLHAVVPVGYQVSGSRPGVWAVTRLQSTTTDAPNLRTTKPEQKEGIFSKHGGKMVLTFLGGVAIWFYRSSLQTKDFDKNRDQVEERCPLDPHEVEELRCTNDLPPETFDTVMKAVLESFPDGFGTYPEFVTLVTSILSHPLRHGHLLDRAILGCSPSASADSNLNQDVREQGRPWLSPVETEEGTKYPVPLLLTAFSVCVNTTPEERIEQLWRMLCTLEDNGADKLIRYDVPAGAVQGMIGLLMVTHQIPAGRYLVKRGPKWPMQHHELASPRDLLHAALNELHLEEQRKDMTWLERKLFAKYNPASEEVIHFTLFRDILRSFAVNAWGECFPMPRKHND